MEKITKYARFIYSKEDEDLIDVLEEALNSQAEEIFDFFDQSLSREIVNIKIIPTKEEYDEISKKRRKIDVIPKWSIGSYYDNTIEYVSLHDYKNTSHAFVESEYEERLDYYKKTIVHEYVHFVTDLYRNKHNLDYPVKWFNEGLATYLSKQKEGLDISFNCSLDDIMNSNNKYDSWYLLTKYVIEECGKDYFLNILGNNELSIKDTPKLYENAKVFYNIKNR